MVPDFEVLCLCASLSDFFSPARPPPRVKSFLGAVGDAEQTARASDFASSYLGLERLTKTNSSGLMIRGVSGTRAAACIKQIERKASPPSSSSNQEQPLRVK